MKDRTHGLRWRPFNKTTKEILILIKIIVNMQNKLYTIQFSHHPTTNSQPVLKQQSQNTELTDFTELLKKDWT